MTRYTGSINGRNDSETFHVELARGKPILLTSKEQVVKMDYETHS